MRIGIIGIGGIGGFIGAKFALANTLSNEHEIIFIQRGEHGNKIAEIGLTFNAKESFTVRPTHIFATTENAGIFDIVFICTKSKDLESTANSIIPNLHNSTTIISLLNGVNNASRIQKVLPNHRILNGCIYVSAAITEPGTVSQKGGAGTIYFGPDNGILTESDKKIESILLQNQMKAILSAEISTEVWRKYLFICPFATMTSRYNLTIGKIVRNEELLKQTHILIQEIIAIGVCFNAKLIQSDIDSVIELALKIPESTPTSMQLDVYSGKYPEIDSFIEFIVNSGKALQINVPLHAQLLPEIQEIIKVQMHG